MPRTEVPVQQIVQYLPEGSGDHILTYLEKYQVTLTITRKRKTILGNYSYKPRNGHHITINGTLNPYAFLITLLHELAHLVAFESYGTRIAPHGQEWKSCFSTLLDRFILTKTFPSDIEDSLLASINSPAASACGDPLLMRVLRRYDKHSMNQTVVEDIPEGAVFVIADGRRFVRGKKNRTRYHCTEVSSGRAYLFHGLYEIISESSR
jgi:hypothetical protein